jgi:hypothetical protein
MDEDIPPLRHFEDMPPVRTQADLYLHWRAMMGKLGFSETLLWVLIFDADGYSTPLIQQIEDTPEVPDEASLADLMLMCREVIAQCVPGGSVAFLRSRPGRAGFTASDRAWASGLSTAALAHGVAAHPVHLVNDQELRVFAPDDAIASV